MNAKSPQQFRFLQALAHGQVNPNIQRAQMPHIAGAPINPGQLPAAPISQPMPNPGLVAIPHQAPMVKPLPMAPSPKMAQNQGMHAPFHLPYKDNLNQSP